MTVETATYISDLNATYPAGGDSKAEGDNHVRLLKSTIKATFANVTGAVTASHTELNRLVGVTSGVQAQLNALSATVGYAITWTSVAATETAVANYGYFADTSGGAFTVTLPASPADGNVVMFVDAAQSWETHSLTIGRNSKKIMGLSEDLTVDISRPFALVYSGATYGWVLI